jgi:NAD-dependent SIR2 family protein deacetylase
VTEAELQGFVAGKEIPAEFVQHAKRPEIPRRYYTSAPSEFRILDYVQVRRQVGRNWIAHDRAGSTGVLKVHGDIWTVRCVSCGQEWEDRRAKLPELPPRCRCGGIERPGVVWFGESLPGNVWAQAEDAAHNADLFLIIGTSAVVYPAAGLAELAKARGARVVEINIAETPVSHRVDASLRGPAAEILPQLLL